MTVPKAPSWTAVFLFGIAYNAIVERSAYGVTACLVIWIVGASIVRFGDWLA